MKTLAEVEKEYILAALDEMRGNRTIAAKELGIGLRTLQRKLKEYGQEPGKSGNYGVIGRSTAVKCLETGDIYPSMAAAAAAIGSYAMAVSMAVKAGVPVNGFTFTKENSL